MARKYGWMWTVVGACWLALLLMESSAGRPLTGRATASSDQDTYRAQYAIDGDLKTRWGSGFTDDAWWQMAFDQPERLAGLHIVWEEAYGERYAIQVSDDGMQWQTVFAETAGDGKTDWIFFEPVTAQFLRLQGHQRGTGWGYSIRELQVMHASQWPTIEAGGMVAGSDPQRVVDGKPNTYWRSVTPERNDVILNLPQPIDLGGLEIVWGVEFATSYVVELEIAEGEWQRVAHIARGNGAQDFVYFPSTRATRIRLRLEQSHRGQGYAIDEIRLKGGDEHATPLLFYQALAQERPRGWYPRWLHREQEFWTITGVPGDAEESLLSESGTFEPYKNGFTVMPFLQLQDQWFSWANTQTEQALKEEWLPLPSVTWTADRWSLHIAAVSFGAAGASSTAVRYRLVNHDNQAIKGRLILAVRPIQLNPEWQGSGFSPIRNIEAVAHGAGQLLRINGQNRMLAPSSASQVIAATFAQGPVLDCLQNQTCPANSVAADKEGKSEAALVYSVHLEAGQHRDVVLLFPLHDTVSELEMWDDPASAFEQRLEEQRHNWQALLRHVSITIPEPKLIHMLWSNLAYILLNQDGPWIKPGPRRYNHAWMRDGSMTSLALLRMGITEPVRRFLQAYIPLVDEKGWVPWHVFEGGKPVEFITDSREGHEYDSQGQFPFLLRRYVAFTGDETLLREGYSAVIRALRYGRQLRRERMTEPYRTNSKLTAYYGILPESNSHEGYYPAMHSYWDDFWYLRGLQDGIDLAERLAQADDAAWMRAELEEARHDLYVSMRRVIERDQLQYLPGSVEKGDFDATSTAIAIMVGDEAAHLPQPYAANTFDQYYEDFVKRLIPGGAESFSPYEVRTAEAFVRLGYRQRALNMLRVFTYDSARPSAWNHLAEVVHGRYRTPSYIGDMPHTWVGSGYISAVRALFAYEEGDQLILAAGIDPDWIADGIRVHDLPTLFGVIHYDIRRTNGHIRMAIEGEAVPPDGFTVRLPREFRTREFRLNGEIVAASDASLHVAALPATLELRERETHD